jgi:hypothetical protein
MVYPEAGTYKGAVTLDSTQGIETKLTLAKAGTRAPGTSTVHVILIVEDDGTPSLVSYRRAIITIK